MIRNRVIVLLTLAGGTGAVGCASLFWPIVVTFSNDARCLRCGVAEGLFRVDYDGRTRAITPKRNPVFSQRSDEIAFSFIGFGLESYVRPSYSWRYFNIHVPFWIPVVLFAAYPAMAFVRGPLRRRHRRKRGRCVGCGYNLTSNVSGVCPECGTEVRP